MTLVRGLIDNNARIPKIIHSMWLSKDDEEAPCPAKFLDNPLLLPSVRKNHASYEFVFWNRRKVKELFDLPELQRWRHFYFNVLNHKEMPWFIMCCDFARYALLFVMGGIYLDLDVTSLRPTG